MEEVPFHEQIVEVELDAVEPEMLFRDHNDDQNAPTPEGIWLRIHRIEHWPVMGIRGPRQAVRAYVELHWGDEALEQLIESGEL